ncbi:malto-oligosyltrehalose synthase [Pantanalinema rosaneae CENA516]|uniref:malto-oligosyltrehalose synthase n=1 Tax=Pantanalinema rosaneae TaxID=1620701 RepID=UPI003D6F369C
MRIPTATYRIQFHKDFPFAAAREIIHYLADLGISDLYASPIFKARAGSTHGYDVVDHTQLNPELGTSEQFEVLVSELQQLQMGWLQDIVPNHMAYDSENPYLMDVLENGANSESSDFFDIEWNHAYEVFRGKVLAPLLGNFYGECLENGEIKIAYDETGLSINYYALKLPVRIESYSQFITQNLGQLARSLGRKHPDFIKLLGALYLIKSIGTETKGRERYDQIAFVKGLLWELYNQNPEIKEFFDSNIVLFNGQVGDSESFNLLDSLLVDQFYRLSFWKVGAEEINYRRFFTVNELISVKVEELKVFHKTHSLIEALVRDRKITGLRIDHIDGLYNPTQYLERLQEKVGDTYITVEKILELQEELPSQWQIQGTSGYESLNYINGIFCQSDHEQRFQSIYSQFTNVRAPYEELVADKKRLIIERNLAGDVYNLAQKLKAISGRMRQGGDFTAYGLKKALTEVLALFPVYRTYISSSDVSEVDRAYIQTTIEQAKERVPLLFKELHFIEQLLLHENAVHLTEEQKAEQLHFVMKLQQLTGPLMAKGVEDTLLYIYNQLLSLNEVGGNPGHFGISLDVFHEFNHRKCDRWLHSMNATATHDTKRGEDVRARLNVISEIPEQWEEQLQKWSELNRHHKLRINGKIVPDRNDEYFLYQTLIGAFPFEQAEFPQFVERLKNYVIKAIREAKVHTAWLRPDSAYEEGYLKFVDQVLLDDSSNEFLQAFRPFQQRVAEYGVFNSLSQVLLKNTIPGVPDLYQGCELWDLSLVDPDNRRPVDYQRRMAFLEEIKAKIAQNPLDLIKELLLTKEDGRVKLFLTAQVLQARKNYLDLFQQGNYQPIKVSGQLANHVVAFARSYQGQVAIALIPRFLTQMIQPSDFPLGTAVWQDTQIELEQGMPTTWKNVITSQPIQGNTTLSVGAILAHFPVALLLG